MEKLSNAIDYFNSLVKTAFLEVPQTVFNEMFEIYKEMYFDYIKHIEKLIKQKREKKTKYNKIIFNDQSEILRKFKDYKSLNYTFNIKKLSDWKYVDLLDLTDKSEYFHIKLSLGFNLPHIDEVFNTIHDGYATSLENKNPRSKELYKLVVKRFLKMVNL